MKIKRDKKEIETIIDEASFIVTIKNIDGYDEKNYAKAKKLAEVVGEDMEMVKIFRTLELEFDGVKSNGETENEISFIVNFIKLQ